MQTPRPSEIPNKNEAVSVVREIRVAGAFAPRVRWEEGSQVGVGSPNASDGISALGRTRGHRK
jgi:hypothetical protein